MMKPNDKPLAVSFTGHRPKDLYGYDKKNHSKYKDLTAQLTDLLKELAEAGYTEFNTGGAQGFDQLAFWAVEHLKEDYEVSNHLYLPFIGQERQWAKEGMFSRESYKKMLSRADIITYSVIATIDDYRSIRNALLKRNDDLLENGDLLIALWNKNYSPMRADHGGTADAIKKAMDSYMPIIIINLDKNKLETFNLGITKLDKSKFEGRPWRN